MPIRFLPSLTASLLRALLLCSIFAPLCLALAAEQDAIVIDGLASENFWQQAQVFDQLVAVEPFTRETPKHQQRIRVVSLPAGIAVHFDIDQPPEVLRTKPNTQRDRAGPADRVNVVIDYDNQGLTAYNFTVTLAGNIEDGIVGRNSFNADWDGDWKYAVQETEQSWTVEMLLPWTITAMAPVDGDTRTIGIYLDRVLKSTGERFAYPAIRYSQSDYVNSLAEISVKNYAATTSNWFPYISMVYDQVNDDVDQKVGLDWFFRYSNAFQLIASLNPDFGQVESDDLVVNFSAIEVFFSDKRPFFTENHDDFKLPLPDEGELIYTRRMGANRDDGKGVASIDVASKLRLASSNSSLSYLVVREEDFSDDIGRQFQVLRPRFLLGDTQIGATIMRTEKPYFDRVADLLAVDAEQSFANGLKLRGQWLQSEIDQSLTETEGGGAWLTLDYNPVAEWQHTLEFLHYDDDLQLSDLGFVQRTNLEQGAYFGRHVQPHENWNTLKEIEWVTRLSKSRNQQGEDLPDWFRLSANLRFANADQLYLFYRHESAGVDDLISRGNGLWDKPAVNLAIAEYIGARRVDMAWGAVYEQGQEGLNDYYRDYAIGLTYFFADQLSTEFWLGYRDSEDWLIWQQANEFNRYRSHRGSVDWQLDWFPDEHQELRLKFQWLNIDGVDGQHYNLLGGRMNASGQAVEDLHINTLGFQLRYRYKLSLLSDIFVVYSRGGFEQNNDTSESTGQTFSDALSLRDADQLLFKWRMHF